MLVDHVLRKLLHLRRHGLLKRELRLQDLALMNREDDRRCPTPLRYPPRLRIPSPFRQPPSRCHCRCRPAVPSSVVVARAPTDERERGNTQCPSEPDIVHRRASSSAGAVQRMCERRTARVSRRWCSRRRTFTFEAIRARASWCASGALTLVRSPRGFRARPRTPRRAGARSRSPGTPPPTRPRPRRSLRRAPHSTVRADEAPPSRPR